MEDQGQGVTQHPAGEASPSLWKVATPKEHTPQGTHPVNGSGGSSQGTASSGESSNEQERQERAVMPSVRTSRRGESAVLSVGAVTTSGGSRGSGGPMCRICHDGDVAEDLISPCWCTGSVALVHRVCLERWLNTATCDTCELCGYRYPLVRTVRPFWQFLVKCDNSEARRGCKVDLVCLFVLTPVAILSVYLCIIGALQYSHENQVSFAVFTEGASRFQRRGRDPQTVTEERGGEGMQAGGWEPMVLVVGAIILIVIYCCWASLTLKYHMRMWRQWRVINQDLTLAYSQPRPSPPRLVLEGVWTPSPGRDAESRPSNQRSQVPSTRHL